MAVWQSVIGSTSKHDKLLGVEFALTTASPFKMEDDTDLLCSSNDFCKA